MDDYTVKLKKLDVAVQAERRMRNKMLVQCLAGEMLVDNIDDLFRLVGELNACHNHIGEALASDEPDIFCILKHLATAIVLTGEVDNDSKRLYEAVAEFSGGIVKACNECRKESR